MGDKQGESGESGLNDRKKSSVDAIFNERVKTLLSALKEKGGEALSVKGKSDCEAETRGKQRF